jgi:Domain of unknown function (DUF222)
VPGHPQLAVDQGGASRSALTPEYRQRFPIRETQEACNPSIVVLTRCWADSLKRLVHKGFRGTFLSVAMAMVAGMTQLLDPPTGADPTPPTPPEPSVVHGLALIAAGLVEVLDAPVWPLGSGQLTDALDRIVVVHRQAEAAYLRLLRELDARGIPAAEGARNTKSWLRERHRLSPGQAKADVAAAAATHPDRGDLASMGDALADGRISRAHVDVAARCLDRIPAHLRCEHGEQIAEFFHRHSLSFPAMIVTGWPGNCWPPSTRTGRTGTTRTPTGGVPCPWCLIPPGC